MRTMLCRMLCFVSGHDFRVVRVNLQKHIWLCMLHPLAGCDAVCARCGERWEDFWTPFDRQNEFFVPMQPAPY